MGNDWNDKTPSSGGGGGDFDVLGWVALATFLLAVALIYFFS